MATTIGRVEYDVDIDGRTLPAQARKIGRDIGKSMGDGTQEEFSKEINDLGKELVRDMQKHGELSGSSFTNSMRRILQSDLDKLSDDVARAFSNTDRFKEYVDGLGGIGEGSEKLRGQLDELNRSGLLSDTMFQRLGNSMDDQVGKWKSNNDAIRSLLISTGGQTKEVERLTNETDRNTESQKRWGGAVERNNGRMSHGARQFLFFTGLFAALGDEIAVLGSAAGSSLAVFGSTLLSGGIAAGVAIAAFKNLGDDIATLPEAIQPAAAAFQGLGDNMSAMQDALEAAALKDLAPTFEKLGPLIDAMIGPLATVATSVGAVATNLVDMLTSQEGVSNLTALILAAGPAFEALMSAVFNLSGALGDVFVVAIPYAQIFSDWLNTLFTDFNNWTSSLEGQNALVEWFENGLFIMGKVGDLIGATGLALSNLVTPASVTQVGQLLDNLTAFMPILSEILGVVGKLNVFGLISELLLELGRALEPVLPALGNVATIISGALSGAFATLGPILGKLLVGLAPVLEMVAILAATLLDALLPALDPIMSVIVALLPPFSSLFKVITPIVAIAGTLIAALSPLLELFATLITLALAPMTLAFELLSPALEAVLPFLFPIVAVMELLNPLIQLATQWIKELIPSFGSAGSASDSMKQGLENLGAIFTWLNDVIIQPVLQAIGTAFTWVHDVMIKPVADAIGTVLAVLGAAFKFMLDTFIQPVIDAIGAAFTWVYDVMIKPIVDLIAAAFKMWGDTFQFLLDNFINPIITNIGLLFEGLWKTFVQPVIDRIQKGWQNLHDKFLKPVGDKINAMLGVVGDVFTFLWEKAIKVALAAIGAAWDALYLAVIKPIGDKISQLVEGVGKVFKDFWEGVVKPALDALGDGWDELYSKFIKPFADKITSTVNLLGTAIGLAFQGAADTIRGAFEGVSSFVRDVFNNIISGINGLIGGINDVGGALGSAIGVDFVHLGKLPMLASGAITNGPMRAIIGEAGPEAVVPLNRPLGAVDPSVRELSAFAQGKSTGRSQDVPTKIINFLAGAIVVQTLGDPEQAAHAVVDRLSEDL